MWLKRSLSLSLKGHPSSVSRRHFICHSPNSENTRCHKFRERKFWSYFACSTMHQAGAVHSRERVLLRSLGKGPQRRHSSQGRASCICKLFFPNLFREACHVMRVTLRVDHAGFKVLGLKLSLVAIWSFGGHFWNQLSVFGTLCLITIFPWGAPERACCVG